MRTAHACSSGFQPNNPYVPIATIWFRKEGFPPLYIIKHQHNIEASETNARHTDPRDMNAGHRYTTSTTPAAMSPERPWLHARTTTMPPDCYYLAQPYQWILFVSCAIGQGRKPATYAIEECVIWHILCYML